MIYLKPSLDKRRQRKDGTFPIVIRLSFKGKSRSIATGVFCHPELWNASNSTIRTKHDSSIPIKNKLDAVLLNYQEKLNEFLKFRDVDTYGIQAVKEFLCNKNSRSTTLDEFWESEILRLESIKNFGNARNYKSAKGGLAKVMNLKVQFGMVDYPWLVKADSLMKANNVTSNSVAVYMRSLRAVYNKAINYGIASVSDYPFRAYKIKSEKTTPRVISIDELKSYFNPIQSQTSSCFDYWNYGRLIFLLRGINFTDLALLTKENIKHGRIVYKRQKTHKVYSVELLPLTNEIFEYYECSDRQTLLPILTNEEYANKACLQARIGQQRKTCNKWLKMVGEELKIDEKLSTYVFRYSWANAAKSLGFSKDLIAEALGHEYGNSVTGIYLNDFDEEKVDNVNLVIFNSLRI